MNSKIGRKLLIAIILSIVLTVTIVNTVTIFRSSAYGDSIMTMHTQSSLNVLKARMAEQQNRLAELYEHMDLSGGISVENTDNSLSSWESSNAISADFAAFYNGYGEIVWQTENFALADFEMSAVDINGYEGLVCDSAAGLTLQYVRPITAGGSIVGASVFGMTLRDCSWLDKVKSDIDTEVTIFNGRSRWATTIMDADGNRIIDTDMSESIAQAVIDGGMEYQGKADIFGVKHYVCYEPFTDVNKNIIGAYFAGYPATASEKIKSSLVLTSIIVAVAVAAVALIIISSIIVKMILTPIKEVGKVADAMSKGYLHEPDKGHSFAHDELGDFVRKLESTKHSLTSYIDDIDRILSEMASGDFAARPSVEYTGDFMPIKNSFETIRSSLGEIIGSIEYSSGEVLSGSEQIAEASKTLADGSTRQAAAIEELSASLNEIVEQADQSAANASEARRISAQSSEKIKIQNSEIQQLLAAMEEIKKRSDEIQNIIKAIDDIAFQTNILALNAAVEAARAGEAGKGFSVVADEVRNLAAKSAESAQQTGTLINATVEAVQKGSVIARGTAEVMKEVNELSDRTNTYIGEISSAMEVEAESITQVKVGIEQISTVVQQNSATAQETAAACSDLSSQSSNLEKQIRKLNVASRQ